MIPGYDEWKPAQIEGPEDITEYRMPDKRRLKKHRQTYEEAEREDRENEYIV